MAPSTQVTRCLYTWALHLLVAVAALASAPVAFAAGVRSDFNGDEIADLAVGAPLADTGAQRGAGMVHIVYGSAAEGLTTSRDHYLFESTVGDVGRSEEGDRFGQVLAAGDFNDDDHLDLAVGIPDREVNDVPDAGAVLIIYGDGAERGLGDRGFKLVTQGDDSEDAEGESEPGDRFGASLTAANYGRGKAADLTVGVPLEDVDDVTTEVTRGDAGSVVVFYDLGRGLTVEGEPATIIQTLSQGVGGLAGRSRAGNRFGHLGP